MAAVLSATQRALHEAPGNSGMSDPAFARDGHELGTPRRVAGEYRAGLAGLDCARNGAAISGGLCARIGVCGGGCGGEGLSQSSGAGGRGRVAATDSDAGASLRCVLRYGLRSSIALVLSYSNKFGAARDRVELGVGELNRREECGFSHWFPLELSETIVGLTPQLSHCRARSRTPGVKPALDPLRRSDITRWPINAQAPRLRIENQFAGSGNFATMTVYFDA
jgi:hypothetical protein